MTELKEPDTASEKLAAFIEKSKKVLIPLLIVLVCILAGYIVASVILNNSKAKDLQALDEITYALTTKSSSLEESVKNLQVKISKMLRDNPSISPFQVAILAALDSESNLLEYLDADTPFINQATKKILKIKSELKKTENGRVQRK